MTQTQSLPWPAGKLAAISLTYDDGHDSLVQHAMPDLEAAGLRGTMYLNTGSTFVQKNADAWREGQLRGHEMGNHSVTHPGRWDRRDAPPPEYMTTLLNRMSEADIFREVNEAADWLDRHVGPDPDRTYAYPNGAQTLGEPADAAPYRRAILSRHRTARGASREPQIDLPGKLDPLATVGYVVVEPTLQNLVDYATRAIEQRGWGIVVFHCVETGWLKVSSDVHRGFVDWLARQDALWTAPVRDVARWLEPRAAAR